MLCETTTSRRQCLAGMGADVLALAGCGGGDSTAPVLSADSSGVSTISASALAATLATYPVVAPLSTDEVASLLQMREEEQLAHDVYAVSATLYPTLPIFANIASAEATHSAAVKTLLDRYSIADPLAGLPNGTFKTSALQILYDALVASSRVSLIQALQVGLQIEELDIRDLDLAKANPYIDNADILMVYDNLQRASRNHLRAFWKVLQAQGGTYTPQSLTQAVFDAIVNSPIETGR